MKTLTIAKGQEQFVLKEEHVAQHMKTLDSGKKHIGETETPEEAFLNAVGDAWEGTVLCELVLPQWCVLTHEQWNRAWDQAKAEAIRRFWRNPLGRLGLTAKTDYFLVQDSVAPIPIVVDEICNECGKAVPLKNGMVQHVCECGAELSPCELCKSLFDNICGDCPC